MSELFEFGQRVIHEQPFSRLIGTELTKLVPSEAVLELQVTDQLKQQHGFVSGGVVSSLADNALTFAGGSVLGDSVTSEYKINFLRPALGDRIIAKATVTSFGKRQAVCECRISALADGQEKLVAVALGTITKVQ
ncbi:PaaI family thioesterase [Marinobacter adhaerens]|uniref:PaaI family thioesterase n=1 Tax=Marinobacter adhaerens TaxID=1033846 RepID=UPI001E41883D|nr:PaaI family thioesterase [Marinobacter adhaerens]MCD1647268.1 PaaI family thioesterase [Marinobacter adhaerens]